MHSILNWITSPSPRRGPRCPRGTARSRGDPRQDARGMRRRTASHPLPESSSARSLRGKRARGREWVANGGERGLFDNLSLQGSGSRTVPLAFLSTKGPARLPGDEDGSSDRGRRAGSPALARSSRQERRAAGGSAARRGRPGAGLNRDGRAAARLRTAVRRPGDRSARRRSPHRRPSHRSRARRGSP